MSSRDTGGSIRLIEVFPGWVNTFTHGCLLSTDESGTQTIIEIPAAKMGLIKMIKPLYKLFEKMKLIMKGIPLFFLMCVYSMGEFEFYWVPLCLEV